MKKTILVLIVLLLIACSNENGNENNNMVQLPTSTLAQLNNDSITIEDVNNHLLSMPSSSRWANKDQNEWLISVIKSLAVKEFLINEAQQVKFDVHPGYINALNKIDLNHYSNYYIQQQNLKMEILEEELMEYYESNLDSYNLPEQRVVHHIFKNKQNNKNEINEVMQRIQNGENFQLLAKEQSDSETRHLNGLIGTVKKGDLSPDFDKVVFTLEKNEPSEIISTKQGDHIFMVINILREKNYSFESVKSKIQKRVYIEKSLNVIKQLAQELPQPEKFFLITKQQLVSANQNTNKNELVLQVNDYKLFMNQFMIELNEIRDQFQGQDTKGMPYLILEEIAYRQIITDYVKKNKDKFNFPEIFYDELAKKQIDKKLEIYSNLKLHAYLNDHPEIINNYFKENEMRFSSSVILELEILKIPMNDNIDLMPLLEDAISKLNSGELTLSDLETQYSGKLGRLKPKNVSQLYNVDTKALAHVIDLDIGEHSNPYTASNNFQIAKLINKIEAKKKSFISVRKNVINQYIKENTAYLYTKISDEILSNLRLNDDAIDLFLQSKKQL